MTDFTELSGTELSEALEFHRRQRNLSRGVNEAMHMRQTKTVRLLEAEEARRLNEENPNHYVISKRRNGEYGVSQRSGNDYSWDHSLHHGTHKTVDAAKTWAAKHAGKYPHKIEVKEEVEQIDELSKKTLGSYVKKAGTDQYLKGQAVQYHTNKAQSADGPFSKETKAKHYDAADKALKKASNRDTGIGRAADRLAKEEVEQIDELSKKTLGSYVRRSAVDVYRTGQNVEAHMNARNATDNYAKQRRHAELTDKARLKASNRITGIERATHKMAKEEVELDEVSKQTLVNYMDKSKKDVKDMQKKYNAGKLTPDEDKRFDRRLSGQNNAMNKFHGRAKVPASGTDKAYDAAQKALKKEEVEINEESKLRITKVYNKWPKPATYAVHNNDRSYHKEFDSMEAAQAHKDEKSK